MNCVSGFTHNFTQSPLSRESFSSEERHKRLVSPLHLHASARGGARDRRAHAGRIRQTNWVGVKYLVPADPLCCAAYLVVYIGKKQTMYFASRTILCSLFIGGTGTTAFVLSWTMYYLCKRPKMLARCREEALRVAPERLAKDASRPFFETALQWCSVLERVPWFAAELAFREHSTQRAIVAANGTEYELFPHVAAHSSICTSLV